MLKVGTDGSTNQMMTLETQENLNLCYTVLKQNLCHLVISSNTIVVVAL